MKDRNIREWYNATWRKSSIMNTDNNNPIVERKFPNGSRCVYHRWIEGINLHIRHKEPYEDGSGIDLQLGLGLHPNYHPSPKLAQLLAQEFIAVLIQHFERTHYEYDSENQALIGTPRREGE